jgi:glycosyltransferase involved in cell wall biosynthesis
MKILIAVHHFPPTFTSGAEWRAHRTARGLQQAGHQVQVVCVESITNGVEQTLKYTKTNCDGLAVHRLYLDTSQLPFQWSYRNPLIGQYVGDLLQEFKPDVLHLISGYLMSGSTVEAAQELGVPVVLTLTDFWFLCPRITLVRSDGSLCVSPAEPLACTLCLRKQKRRYRLLDQLSGGAIGQALCLAWQKRGSALLRALRERRCYLLSLLDTVDAAISPSRFLQSLFEAQGVSPRHFVHMRQGLDVSDWVEAEPLKDNSHLQFGYIGQIAAHKGVDILIAAFQRLHAGERSLRLVICGDMEQFPRFVRQLRKRVVSRRDVVFTGRFEHSKIRQVHAGIDVLVVPSVWYENSPNVILEAFATGTPVVVSRLGGMAELVTDGVNGFQFEAGDAGDLARVLQRFIDQPDLVRALGREMPAVKTAEEEIGELLQVYASPEADGIA